MSFLTPYVIDGKAHSATLFRRAFQTLNSGVEGVNLASDLAVVPLETPGAGFRVLPGDAVIRSRTPGRERESYHVAATAAITVNNVPGTGSSGGRRDAVIVEVRDPEMPGVSQDEDTVRIRVIQNVGSAQQLAQISGESRTTGYVLAFIEYAGANTSTITGAMIKDARERANTGTKMFQFARPRVASDDAQRYLTTFVANGGEYFPGGGSVPNTFTITVPEQATHVAIDASWLNVTLQSPANPSGRFWVEFGNEYRQATWPGKQHLEFTTEKFAFGAPRTANRTDGMSVNFLLSQIVPVPQKLRGKKCTFAFKAGLDNGVAKNAVLMDQWGGLSMKLTFVNGVEDPNIVEV